MPHLKVLNAIFRALTQQQTTIGFIMISCALSFPLLWMRRPGVHDSLLCLSGWLNTVALHCANNGLTLFLKRSSPILTVSSVSTAVIVCAVCLRCDLSPGWELHGGKPALKVLTHPPCKCTAHLTTSWPNSLSLRRCSPHWFCVWSD